MVFVVTGEGDGFADLLLPSDIAGLAVDAVDEELKAGCWGGCVFWGEVAFFLGVDGGGDEDLIAVDNG
jgi:hypothetical protein